jgi:hypothetical protein
MIHRQGLVHLLCTRLKIVPDLNLSHHFQKHARLFTPTSPAVTIVTRNNKISKVLKALKITALIFTKRHADRHLRQIVEKSRTKDSEKSRRVDKTNSEHELARTDGNPINAYNDTKHTGQGHLPNN